MADKDSKSGIPAVGQAPGGVAAEGTEAPPGAEGAVSIPPPPNVAELGAQLLDSQAAIAAQAARILGEMVAMNPASAAGVVDKFVKGLASANKRVVQTCADALPAIAKVQPARVAKHMDAIRDAYARSGDVGKDGIVRTFTTLCLASVAYQKRLEPTLALALRDADPKTLLAWSEVVLPALKGEPHATARAVVEGRLNALAQPIAQKLADQLGVKLRRRPR